MQNAEPDDHIPRGHAETVHSEGHKRDQHAAGEHDRAAAEAPRAKRRAAAGQNDEDHAAILLDEHVPRRQMQIKSDKISEIIDEMHKDDAQDAEPAQRIQLPDPVCFFHKNSL